MSPSDPIPPASGDARLSRKRSFLEWLPWETITIWALFLLAVYALREFFFIVFMTFIVSYSMRGLVLRLSRLASRREPVWLQRILAVICFAGLLAGLYGVGQYFVPELIDQGRGLAQRVGSMKESPQEKLDEILQDTVGRWLFRNKFGGPTDEAYTKAFASYQKIGLHYSEYSDFGDFLVKLERDFRKSLEKRLREQAFEAIPATARDDRLKEWIKKEKVPAYRRENPEIRAEWEKSYREDQKGKYASILDPFESLSDDAKEEFLVEYVAEKIMHLPQREALLEDWKLALGRDAFDAMKEDSSAYAVEFRAYYERRLENDRDALIASFDNFTILRGKFEHIQDYAKFNELREAYYRDRAGADEGEAFSQVWVAALPEDDSEDLHKDQEGFEKLERKKLIDKWKESGLAKTVAAKVNEKVVQGLDYVGGKILDFVPTILVLPVKLSLSLLLAFFIVLDMPKLKKGIDKLRKSRIQGFYAEIEPSLISFGRLIGRAFQAQGLIAMVNTVLTFVAIKLLGIQNEAFLCSIVFLCSFIPVLGVVLSSVPIAVMAIIQDGGGIVLAVWAVVAILVIHFIETSLLNPKILGDMMHLHPVLVLAILAVGQHFFGVWGLLLGVPVVVYVIRFVILDEGIPGIIEPIRNFRSGRPPPDSARAAQKAMVESPQGKSPTAAAKVGSEEGAQVVVHSAEGRDESDSTDRS